MVQDIIVKESYTCTQNMHDRCKGGELTVCHHKVLGDDVAHWHQGSSTIQHFSEIRLSVPPVWSTSQAMLVKPWSQQTMEYYRATVEWWSIVEICMALVCVTWQLGVQSWIETSRVEKLKRRTKSRKRNLRIERSAESPKATVTRCDTSDMEQQG